MPGLKTNEVPGTRAVLRHYRMSAYKARQVLDLIRGQDVDRAEEILRSTPREAARVVSKVLGSAVSNARNNDSIDPEELYVSACYADEGSTLKRWRPRARGRATRIRKRTCHITVIVSRLPEERLARSRARQAERSAALRARRVAASKRAARTAAAEEEPVIPAAGSAEDVALGAEPEILETDVADESVGDTSEDEAEETVEEPLEDEGEETSGELGEDVAEEEQEAPEEEEEVSDSATDVVEDIEAPTDEAELETVEAEPLAEEPEEDEGASSEEEAPKKTRRSRVPRVRKRARGED